MRKGRNRISFPHKAILLLILTACLASHLSFSQKIRNVDFNVVGSTVRITYDIADCSDGKTYDMRLMLGTDTELTEITHGLSGDVRDVPCGPSKLILWDVLSERDELKGRVQFVVVIQRIREEIQLAPDPEPDREPEPDRIQESETYDHTHKKAWSRRSWKDDKGYVGGSIGMFTPYRNFSTTPYNPDQNGFFINAAIGYLPSLFLGISTTVYFYGAPKFENLRMTLWNSCGFMIGPLISLPIGNKIKWELRPQIGYFMIFPTSDNTIPDNTDTKWTGLASNVSTGFRLNFGKRTCYMLNVEYLSGTRALEDDQIEPDLRLLSASFGIAFRL